MRLTAQVGIVTVMPAKPPLTAVSRVFSGYFPHEHGSSVAPSLTLGALHRATQEACHCSPHRTTYLAGRLRPVLQGWQGHASGLESAAGGLVSEGLGARWGGWSLIRDNWSGRRVCKHLQWRNAFPSVCSLAFPTKGNHISNRSANDVYKGPQSI